MNPWVIRILIILLAIGLVPVLVQGTAKLISDAIHGTGNAINKAIVPLYMSSGPDKLDGVILLGLYVIFIIAILRIVMKPRGGRDDS